MAPRIVLVGAGSAQFGTATLSDIFASRLLAGSTVVLHDIDAAALVRTRGRAAAFVAEHGLDFRLEAVADRRAALAGADFCIVSIEVGDRFALWEQDWRLPQQFGLRQVYGENGGPGGLFHTLRVVPPLLDICADIERLCPRALVLNYTNPMTRVCLAVARSHPGLRFVGLCHEVASLGRHLPHLLERDLDELEFRAGGLNHFSFLLELRDRQGADLYPQLRRRAPEYFRRQRGDAAELLRLLGEPLPPPRDFEERHLFAWLLESLGYLPITTDSHLGEYLGWAWRLVDHRGIAGFFTAYRDYCRRLQPRLELRPSGERAVPIIEALVAGRQLDERAVNLPNHGLIDNLPRDLVVEVPGRVTAAGVQGVALGRLPAGLAALMQAQYPAVDLAVEAARRGSHRLALQALLADPVVDDAAAAAGLLDAMIELQRPYLDYLK